ncbi:hypothetical protein FACS189491_01020 [Spirochaetia bacterium]|nr:hypothetical protein FACS189491_01020 [Spirochaetia bacterium]
MVCLACLFAFTGVFSAFARGNTQRGSRAPEQNPVELAEAAARDDLSDKVEVELVSLVLDSQEAAPELAAEVGRGSSPGQTRVNTPPSRAEVVMRALAAGYPDRLGEAVYRNGDWAVLVRGVWYYYAEGRLLPEELRGKASEYDPQPFYNYPEKLPPWRTPGPEETARFRAQTRQLEQHPPKRSQHFYDALFRARTRAESYDRLKTIRLFGKQVLVHYSIMEELALVEERLLAESKTNAQVRQWINSINTLQTWNWRNIAATEARSFHAYGTALDFLPKSTKLATYWLWSAETQPDWWTIPYEKRLHPPDAVIKAFEAYGFAWGGKWSFFDTMHFEYRPEIFILNNLPISDIR